MEVAIRICIVDKYQKLNFKFFVNFPFQICHLSMLGSNDFDSAKSIYTTKYHLKNVAYDVVVDISARLDMIKLSKSVDINKRCAICREFLMELCSTCKTNKMKLFHYNVFESIIYNKLNILELRQNTTLKDIPKDVIKMIEDRIPIETTIEFDCCVSRGICGHIYHTHCLKRWLTKRDSCPLDNRFWTTNLSDLYHKCKISRVL